MAKTFYDLLKEMLSSNLTSEVTEKIQGILNALDKALSVDAIQGYMSMFMGLAASLIIIYFCMDVYSKVSKELITVQQLFVCFMKLVIAVFVVVLTPQLLHTTFRLALGIYGTVENHISDTDDGAEMYLYGVKIGFNPGKKPVKKTEKTITEKKENLQKKDKTVYLFQSTDSNLYRVYEMKETLLEEHPNAVECNIENTEQLAGDALVYGVYYELKGSEVKTVLENLGASSDSVINYDVIESGDSGRLDAAGIMTFYKADGTEVTISPGASEDDVLDENGFPVYEYCNAKKGTTEDGDEKTIKEAMEDTFGATWVGAATKGSFSIMNLFIAVVISLLNKLCVVVIFVFCVTNALAIMVRTVYAPFAVVQMFEEGSNNNAIRYIKKYFGVALNMVSIVVVLYAASKLQVSLTKILVGSVYMTSENIEDVISKSYWFLIVKGSAVVTILGATKISTDVTGA